MTNQHLKKPIYSERYKWFALIMLTLVGTFSFFDRQLIVILAEPIKQDLDLSDTQMGLMTGMAFAIFYCVMGIPIARFADTSNRRNIVVASLAIWSFMTSITGYVQGFTQMLLARIGVGIGEAGGTPSSQAMISDYFPIEKRPIAFAIYASGIYFGLFLGFALGGYFAETLGWRKAFQLVGLPGILFAILVYFTVKEPPRGYSETTPISKNIQGLKSALLFLYSRKTFVYICAGASLHSFVGYAFAIWIASFFQRVHGMGIAEVGMALAISIGLGGAVGTFSGGYIVEKLAKKDRRWYMWISIVAIILTIPFSTFILVTNNGPLAAACYFIPNVLFSLNMGAVLTVTQAVVGVNMRALAGAVYYFIINLVGMGFGPLLIGSVSDHLIPTYGDQSLRFALLGVTVIYIFSIYFYYKASETLEAEMDNVVETG